MTQKTAKAETPPLPPNMAAAAPMFPANFNSGEEPFYKSVRFWVSVLTPIIAALISAYSDSIPWLESLDQVALNTWLAGFIVTAVTFVLGRTWRNIDISGGLIKVRENSRPALPGRVVGLTVIKARPEEADGGGPKENPLTSKRFWTAVITPIVAAGLGALVQVLPEAAALDSGNRSYYCRGCLRYRNRLHYRPHGTQHKDRRAPFARHVSNAA